MASRRMRCSTLAPGGWAVLMSVAAGAACTPALSGDDGQDDTTDPASGGGEVGRAPARGPGGAVGSGSGGAAGAGGSGGGAAGMAGRADGGAAAPADALTGQCAPTGGGPHWLEEGQTVRFTVSCATGMKLPGDAFQLPELPAGAAYDPATATFSWTPKLDQAATHYQRIVVARFGEQSEVKIGVADKYDDPANVPVKIPGAYHEEFGLPVFHVTASPMISGTMYTPATLVYKGRTYMLEAKYRGASSLAYPKKNITLRFPKEDKFADPLVAGGYRKRRRVALITTFDDNSYVRWRMAFELWNRIDPMNIKIQHFSGILFLNGRYHGLYAVADKIDDNVMGAAGLSEEGNLHMGINHSANFQLTRYPEGFAPNIPKVALSEGYEKKEGLPEQGMPGAFNDLIDLVRFVATSDDAKFTAEIEQRMRIQDVYNWIIHCVSTIADDTYGKNSLLYHDIMNNGPWRITLWDFNASWGQTWNTVRRNFMQDPGAIVLQTDRNLLWRRLWNLPKHGPALRARWKALLGNEIKVETVLGLFDAYVKEVDASARRDERKWQASYRSYYLKPPLATMNRTDFTDFAAEVAYTRKWIQDRWGYLPSRL